MKGLPVVDEAFGKQGLLHAPAVLVRELAPHAAWIERGDGKVTYAFQSYEPDGILMIPIAPYRTVANGPHRIFHFPDSAKGAEILMGNLERVMALFASWFGQPPRRPGNSVPVPEF